MSPGDAQNYCNGAITIFASGFPSRISIITKQDTTSGTYCRMPSTPDASNMSVVTAEFNEWAPCVRGGKGQV